MDNLCRILVPTDFSPRSEGALDYAWFLARRVRGAIDLLHVRNAATSAAGAAGDPLSFADTACDVAMQGALSERQRPGGVEIRGHVEIGEPCETIVRIATTGHFDLIVMGQSGARSSVPPELGGIARRVAHSVRCPVIKVRAALEDGTRLVNASGAFRRVELRAA
jgi:nucleotide-binding universal stress UspA family protein